MRSLYRTGRLGAAILLVAACQADRATAPTPPDLPSFMNNPAANQLLSVHVIEYEPGEGLVFGLGLDRGVIEAANQNSLDWVIELAPEILITDPPVIEAVEIPVIEIKSIAISGQHAHFEAVVPWDGTDGDGTALHGVIEVRYTATLVWGTSTMPVRSSVTGSMFIVIE